MVGTAMTMAAGMAAEADIAAADAIDGYASTGP